jgi:ribosome-binding factor A
MTRRIERLNHLIRDILSELLQRQLKDPRLSDFVTVTRVSVSPDLQHAKVFVSVMGSESDQGETLKALYSASGFLRKELGARLTLRHIPQLSFQYDNSIERGSYVFHLIEQVASANKADLVVKFPSLPQEG